MKRINLFPRFAPLVLNGQMTQHILRGNAITGEVIELWSARQRLGLANITMQQGVTIEYKRYYPLIRIDGDCLQRKSMEAFARRIGFPDVATLIDFLSDFDDLPFSGKVMRWELVKEGAPA